MCQKLGGKDQENLIACVELLCASHQVVCRCGGTVDLTTHQSGLKVMVSFAVLDVHLQKSTTYILTFINATSFAGWNGLHEYCFLYDIHAVYYCQLILRVGLFTGLTTSC
jgi:hypothetical protein